MKYGSNTLGVRFKLVMSVLMVCASFLLTSKTWANTVSTTTQKFTPQSTIQIAHRGGRYWRGPGWRGPGWRGPGWRVGYPYWGGWSPFWRGGVYCKRQCLYNQWGNIVRCRTTCF